MPESFTSSHSFQPDFENPAPYHALQDSSIRRRLVCKIGASIAGIATLVSPTALEVVLADPAHADSSLVYPVVNTEGGVYSRNSPHEADTPRIVGQGAYDGDQVELLCGVTNGDAVGPYSNNTWHKVKNLTRPEQPEFWLNDRYVQSPNVADELAPGEVECGAERAPASNSNPPGLLNRAPQSDGRNWAIPVTPDGQSVGGQDPQPEADPTTQHAPFNYEGTCRGPFWGVLAQQTCVNGEMGEKDYTNRREWVGNVDVNSPDAGPGTLEIWGDGFYYRTGQKTKNMWYVGRWVREGTNICGAGTDRHGVREVSCFKINLD